MNENELIQDFTSLARNEFGENEFESVLCISQAVRQLVLAAGSSAYGLAIYKAIVNDIGRSGITTSAEFAAEVLFESQALAIGNRDRHVHESFAHSDLSISEALHQRFVRETRYLPMQK